MGKKTENSEEIILGYSDYSHDEFFSKKAINGIGNYSAIMEQINLAAIAGYTIHFKTSLFRRIFLLAKYKIVAIKK